MANATPKKRGGGNTIGLVATPVQINRIRDSSVVVINGGYLASPWAWIVKDAAEIDGQPAINVRQSRADLLHRVCGKDVKSNNAVQTLRDERTKASVARVLELLKEQEPNFMAAAMCTSSTSPKNKRAWSTTRW